MHGDYPQHDPGRFWSCDGLLQFQCSWNLQRNNHRHFRCNQTWCYFDIQVRNLSPARIHDIRYHSPELCRKLHSHLKRNSVFPRRI